MPDVFNPNHPTPEEKKEEGEPTMDNNDNHLKSPQTGGLKLMTVFIVVLALHVVVIGGFTVYHLMSGGGTDADFAGDKAHKGVKIADADAPLPDGSPPAPATASNPSPATTTPAPDASSPAEMNPESAEPPATTTAATPPAPAPDAGAPSTPATPPDASATAATTPAAPAATTASEPSGPIASGPVIMSPSAPDQPTVQNDQTAEQEAVAPTALDGDIAPAKPYTVKLHDSLEKIAHRNHVSVAQLRETNNLKTDMLRIGQKLMIPAATEVAATDGAKAPASASVSHGPDRTLLGDDVPDSAVPSKKTVASTAHDEALVMPAAGSRHTYTVVKGDTLSKIAHRFHMTTSALMAANDSVDARKLRIGQKLRIPSQGSRSANIAAPAPVAPPAVPQAQPEPAEIQPMATPSAQLANFMP
jgi:LysM repeat protein